MLSFSPLSVSVTLTDFLNFLATRILSLVISPAICFLIAFSVCLVAVIFCTPYKICFLIDSISFLNSSGVALAFIFLNSFNMIFFASTLCSFVRLGFLKDCLKYVIKSSPNRSHNTVLSSCLRFCLFSKPKPINIKAFKVASFGSPVSNNPEVNPTNPSAGILLNGLAIVPVAPKPVPSITLFNTSYAFSLVGIFSSSISANVYVPNVCADADPLPTASAIALLLTGSNLVATLKESFP